MARTVRTVGGTIICNRVRELRKARGLSLEALAAAAGIHFTHLGKIERGERDLNYQWALRIAAALSLLPADLYLFEDGGLEAEERELIETYRSISPALRSTYMALVQAHQQYREVPASAGD